MEEARYLEVAKMIVCYKCGNVSHSANNSRKPQRHSKTESRSALAGQQHKHGSTRTRPQTAGDDKKHSTRRRAAETKPHTRYQTALSATKYKHQTTP